MKWYLKEALLLAGMTLKNPNKKEENNMAFHTAKDPRTVLENRQALAQSLGIPLTSFVFAQQTHSDHFYEVKKEDQGRGALEETTAIPDTDALYTKEKNLVLTVCTADCVPVFFYNERAKIIGIIHSGWSGTVKEITPKTLDYIRQKEAVRMEDFSIVIGSALCQEHFEVDRDVYELFSSLGYADPFITYKAKRKKFHIDNQQVIKEQCRRIGILEEKIQIDTSCTFSSPTGFSYRQDRQAGRHLSFIVQR